MLTVSCCFARAPTSAYPKDPRRPRRQAIAQQHATVNKAIKIDTQSARLLINIPDGLDATTLGSGIGAALTGVCSIRSRSGVEASSIIMES
jgi:hypothetical protein